jgi:hypothetical protein
MWDVGYLECACEVGNPLASSSLPVPTITFVLGITALLQLLPSLMEFARIPRANQVR